MCCTTIAMEKRFHADPLVQATELLLQERIPVGVPAAHPRAEEVLTGRVVRTLPGMITRVYDTADLPTPRTQLLSNGTYNVMITTAGAGYSDCGRERGHALARRRDARQLGQLSFTCATCAAARFGRPVINPFGDKPQSYEVAFSEDKADFWRSDAGIVTHMEVVVSAEDNAEVRRVSSPTTRPRTREIELTSYAEVVLRARRRDAAHPAFSNLFIETEFFAAENAILAHRRPALVDDEANLGSSRGGRRRRDGRRGAI